MTTNMTTIVNPIGMTYATEFWDALKMRKFYHPEEPKAKAPFTGACVLPSGDAGKYLEELKKENFFRNLATVIPMYMNDYTVHTISTEAEAEWVPEGEDIPEDEDVLNEYRFHTHKLTSTAKIHDDMLADKGFDFESWLLKKFAQRFGKAEVKAFLTGTGEGQPTGILADNGGAEIGVTTASDKPTFDEVMALFYSLDPKFRNNAVWVMNDETELHLRTLKDKDGNYLWAPTANRLLGKDVIITNAMPGIESGAKPIAFGNFEYYWIMERVPFAVRILQEKYTLQQLRGYVGFEHLDAKLIRPEAIKVMKVATA